MECRPRRNGNGWVAFASRMRAAEFLGCFAGYCVMWEETSVCENMIAIFSEIDYLYYLIRFYFFGQI